MHHRSTNLLRDIDAILLEDATVGSEERWKLGGVLILQLLKLQP